jgi:hypothetical protein
MMGKYAELREQVKLAALTEYRNAWWLKSEYGAETLVAEFPNLKTVRLSFGLTLRNGLNLASPEATKLRCEIYDFLCIQGHPGTYGTRNRTPLVDRRHLLNAARIVDHFLLSDDGKLARHGFGTLGTQDIARLLIDLASAESADEGLYAWHSRLTEFLREEVKQLSLADVKDVLDRVPAMAEIARPRSEWRLTLSADELVRARAFLYRKTLSVAGRNVWAPNLYETMNTWLQRTLYVNTLLGRFRGMGGLRLPSELTWSARRARRRERDGVGIAGGRDDKTCSETKVEIYRCCLLSWTNLAKVGVGFDESVLAEAAQMDISDAVSLKRDFGFNMVPPHVVVTVLRQAICFFYQHGSHLLNSMAAMLNHYGKAGMPRVDNAGSFDVTRLMLPETLELGVREWTVRRACEGSQGAEYAKKLRGDCSGLWDITTVLYGACLIIVGAVQAARQGELLDLNIDALDDTKQWLGLLTRKSGYDGVRNQDFRPTPQVAVDVLETLNQFLRDVDAETDLLFAMPTRTGLLRCDADYANEAIDKFLDYIDSPTDEFGRRYYLRQHQLRKFFVSVFFQCLGFASLEVLRWFMRHLDAKHLWAYIRASTPGSEMRHHMATAAVLLIRNGAPELEKLSALLKSRFNVSSLDVISDKEMEELLTELQKANDVEFEPVFSTSGPNRFVRLGVVVWGSEW